MEELTAIATIDLRVDYLRAPSPDATLRARRVLQAHPQRRLRACGPRGTKTGRSLRRLSRHLHDRANSGGSPFGGLAAPRGQGVKRLVAAIPYARLLGIDIERVDGGLECVLPFRDDLIGNTRLPASTGASSAHFSS